MNEELVNVLVITYNHEKYIENAIKSILSQKTDFKFNIIVGEDKSTDSTRKILLNLQKKYPQKIELLLHNENIGAKRNLRSVEERCTAPYIAILEGDDYWIDDNKLQNQVNFLIKNKEYSACVHDINIVNEENEPVHNSYHEKMYSKNTNYDKKELSKGILPGQSATMVCRNILNGLDENQIEKYYSTQANGDWRRTALMLSYGPIYRISDKMSNYRYVTKSGDSWNAKVHGKNFTLENFQSFIELKKLTENLGITDCDFLIAKQNVVFSSIKYFIKKPNKENFDKFKYLYSQEEEKNIFWVNFFKKLIKKN